MQFYAATGVTVFTLLFSVLYLVPPVRNLAYFLSLSVVLVIASHYTTVYLLYMLAYKTVTPKGKVVVVTRCDSGYGNRLAIELDRRGFTVVAGCVNEQSDGSRHIKNVCSERVHVIQTDVTQPESLVVFESRARKLCKNENQLWAVIINLSVVSLGELEWYNDEDMRWTYEVNVLCVARVARVFLPLLRESPYYGRRFVIVNSVWGRISVPGTGPYCMSKFAVRCFSEVLRRELLKFGIYVVAVEPNLYRLPQTEPSTLLNSYKVMWDKLPDSIKDAYSKGYADEMESNIRNILATEPDPVVLDVAKKMLDAVRITNPSRLYQPDLLSRRILYTIFSQAPDEITDFYLTEIAGLMKA